MLEEKPIKLFDKRSERYPEPEIGDIPEAVVRAGLVAIPIIGGSINEMLSLVLAPSVERRRGEWLKDLANLVEELAGSSRTLKLRAGNKNRILGASERRPPRATHNE